MAVAETTPLHDSEGQDSSDEKRVSPLELFFDLVFVFALTQVTALMADNPTWTGLGEGMLVLAMLWWAWASYSWLTNFIAADEGVERLLMFVVMGAFLVAALAAPHAFTNDALVFALAYAAVRWLHIFIFAEANDDVDAGMAIRRLARTAIPGPALLIVAAFLDPPYQAARLDTRAGDRLRRALRVRSARLSHLGRALRRALLPHHHHRPGRVDRRHRRGNRRATSTRGSSPPPCSAS